MASCWIETRKTPKGHRYRVIWREVAFDAEGRPVLGPKRWGSLLTDPDKVEQQRLNKVEELEGVEAGLKPKIAPKSLRWAADRYLEHSQKHKARRTFENFDRRYVEAFVGFTGPDRRIQTISTEDVQAWEATMSANKPAGVSIRLRVLRAFLTYARKAGWVADVPHFQIPHGDEVGRALPPHEIDTIFAAASPRMRRGLTVLLYTGMRLGELFGLEWNHIRQGEDGAEATIKTLKRKQGEGGRHRVVLLHQRAQDALGEAGAGKVMPMTRYAFEAEFQTLVKRLKLPRTRFHDFRHTWATRFMEKTGDLYGLMRLGGWKDLKSVERYQHLTRGRSKAILDMDFGLKNTQKTP